MNNLFIVDAFTDKPFSGNPAAVCILQESKPDEWLQKFAAEMNLSETAFVKKDSNGFSLRWFTPEVEVELCGHATLAASHVIWQNEFINQNQDLVFHSVYSGTLTASKNKDEITLNFPSIPTSISESTPDLEKALGAVPVSVHNCGKSEYNFLVELESESQIRNLKPDFNLMAKLPKFGVIITAKSDNIDYDFVSRYFAPAKGINEDPVTGSAHCSLAPYWSKKLGKTEMKAFQASKRGGSMIVRIENDRVFLTGKAVTITEGKFLN